MPHASQEPTPSPGLRFEGRPVDLEKQDEYDALADLFLGDDPADLDPIGSPRRGSGRDDGADSDRRVELEGLILGHLPVRGGAWTGQYAEAIAQSTGRPVALLRVNGEQVSIDVYGQNESIEPTSLETALLNAAHIAPRWIIQCDELGESDLVGRASLDQLTLMAGGNEASIVATYRTIKGVLGASDEGPALACGPRSMALAIVGADRNEALRIRERIERASKMFLNQPLTLSAVIERVGTTSGTTIFEGTSREGIASILDGLASRLVGGGVSMNANTISAPAVAAPVTRPEACQAATTRPVGRSALAEHLGGLIALSARCPDDPETELAVDHAGTIHLLREDASGFERLAVTQAWAQKHASLLALTTPDTVAIDPSAAPVVHLFSAEPKRVRHLLDTDVRVHLRARVTTDDGHSGWFTTELN